MRILTGLLAAVAVSMASPAATQETGMTAPAGKQQGIESGREASRLLWAGDQERLAQRMSPAFLAAIGGTEGLGRLMQSVRDPVGAELAVKEEHAFREAGLTSYYRRGSFEKLPDVTVYWVFDGAGVLVGGTIRPTQPEAATNHLDYRTRALLRLPFGAPAEGRWYVGWGGRDVIHNYHAAFPDQRFAYDLYVRANDIPFRTDGKSNADYYCFGQPILAPAAGTVVAAVDGLADNPPGQMDRANPVGNHLVIDHGGEFSFLAHLQLGSVTARPGDQVGAGQPIGRCGNSGNTTMPHLHYHLQTTPVFSQGEGLPAQFNDYRADGEPVARGEPRRGEYLDP